MQENIKTVALTLPEAQLYVVVVILIAVTAITAADIRDKIRLLPSSGENRMAIILAAAAWLSLSHIIFTLVGTNDIYALSWWGVAGMLAHALVLVLLLVTVSIWYWTVALHKKTPAGISMATEQDQ